MLLMWTLNVSKWSFERRPSAQLFLGGNTVSKEPVCFHVDIRTRSFVTSSICTMAHSQSDFGRRGGTIKTKDPDILFCRLSHFFFVMSERSEHRVPLSFMKLRWILFASVWVSVHEVHLSMWLTSTAAASLSVLYGNRYFRLPSLFKSVDFFYHQIFRQFIKQVEKNVLLLWKKGSFIDSGKISKNFFHWLQRVGSAIFWGSPPACSIITL